MDCPFAEGELKRAAERSFEIWFNSLPDPTEFTHVFSPRYERKMQRLMKKIRRNVRRKQFLSKIASIFR